MLYCVSSSVEFYLILSIGCQMAVEDTVKKRIEELLSEINWLTQFDDDGTFSNEQQHECSA